jgi:hypothetical protein
MRGPFYAVSWHPLERELLPGIEELTAAREFRFNTGALLLQRALRGESD